MCQNEHIIVHLLFLYFCFRLDPTLTVENVTKVMEKVQDWEEVGRWLGVPQSKRDEIKEQFCTEQERRHLLGEYWVNTAPHTWERLALALQVKKENRAAAMACQYLPKGMSIA